MEANELMKGKKKDKKFNFDKLISCSEALNNIIFEDFSEAMMESFKRREKAIILLYIFQSVVDDKPLSVTIQEYEWAESQDAPKVEYKEFERFLNIKSFEMPETRLFLRRRNCPNFDIPIHDYRQIVAETILKLLNTL